MSDLLIPSLEIKGYRLFEDLRISRLGRVNLLTGKNNAGKTAILEALRLYSFRGALHIVDEILDARDEARVAHPVRDTPADHTSLLSRGLRHLFHDRTLAEGSPAEIRIGVGVEPPLSIRVQWDTSLDSGSHRDSSYGHSALIVETPGGKQVAFRLDESIWPIVAGEQERWAGAQRLGPNCVFVPVTTLSLREISRLWDAIDLTPHEETVVAALQLVAPELQRVSVSSDLTSRGGQVVRAKLSTVDEPVSLGSLGDGMSRIFGITLALVNARDGMLLIDEVENGIHYTVQHSLWKLIFEVASRLNVQVFATTHSYDCITAFQAAAHDHPDKGMLLRLNRRDSKVTVTSFDEEELAVVAREEIEVR